MLKPYLGDKLAGKCANVSEVDINCAISLIEKLFFVKTLISFKIMIGHFSFSLNTQLKFHDYLSHNNMLEICR